MRFLLGFSLALLVLLSSGCGNLSSTAAADGSASSASSPVGPVPGQVAPVSYPKDPLLTDTVGLQDGQRLFNWYNCSGCHGGHGGGGMGPSLRDNVWRYGSRDDQIYDSIAQGRSQGMPAWGSKIPSIQIWELVAYIKSMRTAQEPEPPVEPSDEMVPNPDRNTALGIGTQTAGSEIPLERK